MSHASLQHVIDLSSLITDNPVLVQSALCADDVRTPFLMSVAFSLEPQKRIYWMVNHLKQLTAQASLSDLQQVEKALKQKNIHYEYTMRPPVESKKSVVRSDEHARAVLARIGFGIHR